MKLETLLTPTDMTQFNQLVSQAHQAGAGAVRMHIVAQNLVVIGILGAGELQTWFASPANDLVEALVTERVVLSGIELTAAVLREAVNGCQKIATEAITKASKFH